MVPQANVFLLGLPLKLMIALATVVVVLLTFPGAIGEVMSAIEDTFVDVLIGLSPWSGLFIGLALENGCLCFCCTKRRRQEPCDEYFFPATAQHRPCSRVLPL
jgi:hypothetical protein